MNPRHGVFDADWEKARCFRNVTCGVESLVCFDSFPGGCFAFFPSTIGFLFCLFHWFCFVSSSV